MKFEYLRTIDREGWEQALRQNPVDLIYAQPWYLDVVSPGWQALVIDNYAAVVPLTINRKMLIPRLLQPLMTQQLGIIGKLADDPEVVAEILRRLQRRYRKGHIYLQAVNPGVEGAWHSSLRRTYELDLRPEADPIKLFRPNQRKAVSEALNSGLRMVSDFPLGDFMAMQDQFVIPLLGAQGATVRRLTRHLAGEMLDRGQGRVMAALDRDGRPLSSALIGLCGHRATYLAAANSDEGKRLNAGRALLHNIFESLQKNIHTFDFEGGNNPQLRQFFRTFQSREVTFSAIRWGNRLL